MSSLSLLPPEIKLAIEQRKKNSQLVNVSYQISICIFISLVVAGVCWFVLDRKESGLDERLKKIEADLSSFGNLENDASELSKKILDIKQINSKLNSWSGLAYEIQKNMPQGAYLSKVDVDADSKIRGKITGFAKNKGVVANLRDSMENSNYFEYVDIESITTEIDPQTKKETESFILTFSLSKEALDD